MASHDCSVDRMRQGALSTLEDVKLKLACEVASVAPEPLALKTYNC